MFSFAQTEVSFSSNNNNTTINTCNGFIIDSGGQGGSGYSNGEDIVITICPDTPGEIISVVFNLFDLDLTDDNPSPTAQNVDYMFVYDGTSTSDNSLGVYTGNDLQGVVIQATDLNTTGCLTFRFKSNTVGTGNFAGSASCETPCSNPISSAEIIDGITADSIMVCVGQEVNFQDNGSFAQPGFSLVDYSWDFMDGSVASGQTVSHTFNNPGQYIVQLWVTDDNGCTNPNLTELQVLVATEPDFINFPSDVELCIGEEVTFSTAPQSYQVEWAGFPGSASVEDGCLTDDQLGVAQNIELTQTGFAAGTVIENVNDIESICLEMEHSFVGDLVIILECPNGQNVVMYQQNGGSTSLGEPNEADNVNCDDPSTQGVPYTYCFTPSATQTWVEWINANSFPQTLPAGDYESLEPLDQLVGCPTNGVWTLSVIDNWAADDGTLFSFGLNLAPSYYPDITTFEPQIGANADSSFWEVSDPYITSISSDGNEITVTPTDAGTYTYHYTVTDNFGCVNDTSVSVSVLGNAELFLGNDTTICDGEVIALDPTFLNPIGACEYTLLLEDTWGDGWNGNNITVSYTGSSTNYTIASGSTNSIPLSIPFGESVTVTFNANGSFVNECQYELKDDSGATLFSAGPNLSGPTTNSFTADCSPDYTVDWASPANLSDPSILTPTWSPTADETLVLTVYPVGHPDCVSSDDISVTVIPEPDAGEDATLELCAEASPVDLYTELGGTPDAGGTWTNASGAVVSMPFNPATMQPGIYTYEVGGDACIDHSTVDVSVVETVILDFSKIDVDCHAADNGSIYIQGQNIDFYSLNGATGVNVSDNFTVNNLAPGNYTIVVSSNAGCTDMRNFTITEPTALSITSISNDELICPGDTVELTGMGTGGSSDYTYSWLQNGALISHNQTITIIPPTGTTEYCLVFGEECGSPTDQECLTITNPEEIFPMIEGDTLAGCNKHSVDFVNLTASSEVWTTFIDFGDGDTLTVAGNNSFSHTYQDPGLYDVSVLITSIYGCHYENFYPEYIESYPNPVADFVINPNPVSIFYPVVQVVDQSTLDVTNWSWIIEGGVPGATNEEQFEASFPEGQVGQYPITLYVENEYGCTDSIEYVVSVENDVTLFAPNTFTPDADEFNQSWRIYLSGIDVYDYTLFIYNRWGEVVWESHDIEAAWDGTFKGREVQSGTYVWTIECRDKYNDEKFTFNGHLNVLR